MATMQAGVLSLLCFLLFLLPLPSSQTTLYVTPTPHTPCPAQPCHTLSQYVENATKYFISNTTMKFLPGEHILETQANITNVTRFSMVGECDNASRIVCSGFACSGFYFENDSFLEVSSLGFVSHGQSITAVHVHNLQILKCIFANSSNTALIAHNSNLLLEGSTFVNNSGGSVTHMTFTPGGGIAVVFSNMTLQGRNLFLNNTMSCTSGICGGGALYGENSTVYLEGNTSFINNTATSTPHSPFIGGGGGLLLFNTATNINGYVNFVNNSINSTYPVENACEIGGGGASLLLCNVSVSVSAQVMLSNNLAEGDSGCGGGIYLHEGNMNLTGSMVHTYNYAGYIGGGIYLSDSSMDITGSVVHTNNHAGRWGGGIDMQDSNVNIVGSVVLTDNYVGYAGGGIHMGGGNMDISGEMSVSNNSAGSSNIKNSFGGGINVLKGNMSVTGIVLLTNNYAGYTHGGEGGGLNMQSSSLNVTGTMSLTNNSADMQGGGIAIITGSMTIISGNVSSTNNSAGLFGGGLLSGGSTITLRNAFFTDNHAGLQGGGILAQGSSVIMTGTTSFTKNSAGRFGGGIVLISCSMHVPGTVSYINNSAVISGGGIDARESTVTVSGNVLFTDNSVGYTGRSQGGGWNLQSSTVNITGTISFIRNSADYQGGGITIVSSSVTSSGDVSLTNNSASSIGGGMSLISSNTTLTNILVTDNNAGVQGGGMNVKEGNTIMTGRVSFINNSAVQGGGYAMQFNGSATLAGNVSFTDNSAGTVGGGIILDGSSINFNGNVTFTSNSAINGGGINMKNSTLNVNESVVFVSNRANNHVQSGYGGGIYLESGCQLEIDGRVYFTENYADLGGAFYVYDYTPLVYCASDAGANCVIEECFFQIPKDNTSVLNNLLVFEGNVAEVGNVLYGGSVDRCRLEGHPEAHSGEVFDMIANYSKQPDTLSVISSNPFRACLCENHQPNCSDTGNVTAYPGQRFLIGVVAVGQRNGTAYATIHAVTYPLGISSLGVYEDRQGVDNKCTELHYTFFSSESSNSLEMSVDGSCSSLDGSKNRISIPVHLLPCPPAFTLSESPYGCICEKRLQKYTNSCDISNQTILRDGDFWVGYDNQSHGHGLILHPHCPFDYCKTKPIHFILNETDLQCNHDRVGLLCGACPPNLSLALGSSRCLHCSDAYLSLLLPFAVMGLVVVLFLLSIRLTVKVGTVSGLILYANIVGANQNTFFPPGSKNFLAVSIAWFKLDLGIETCFYNGLDTYAKTWLQFVFPLYIWGLIGLIIFISERSIRVSRMLGSNPVEVIATLFILSYGKILRTIVSALSFTTLQYPKDETRVVWLYDANINYLHGKHIPLFIAGVLFFALVFLPLTLLLLLGQWLQAFSHLTLFSWMNNLKLKAFLDAYHAPYNKKHRYWPGLILVVRFALLLVFSSNALHDNSANLLAISAASFGLLAWPWMIESVYKNPYLGALEASYILNLGVLAVATTYVQKAGGNQAVVAYTSTGIAFVTFIAIVIYHIYLQTNKFWRNRCGEWNDRQQNYEHDENSEAVSVNRPLITPSTTYVSYGRDRLREPLLTTQ